MLSILSHKKGSVITRQENKIFDNHEKDKKPSDGNAVANGQSRDKQSSETSKVAEPPASSESVAEKMPAFRVPPATAIAGVLIRDWANGKIGAGGWNSLKKGNL